MCGITGYVDFVGIEDRDVLNRMVDTLRHRGPDDRGTTSAFVNTACVGLGHTRLSIIDVSKQGHQPMTYRNLSIVFNGEIYNYNEIKGELITLGHQFKSNADTEVILHSFEEWGTACVSRFIGMFSFVILDRKERLLYAFRDRAGVKPFFYYQNQGIFLFGSELKALFEHPRFEKLIDIKAVYSFFDYGYVPSPYSIFKNTHKLDPGSFLKLDLVTQEIAIKEYWNPVTFYTQPKLTLGYEEAKEELHSILKSAFNYRMVADVQVGIFLSGGYDSTAVAAILQSNRTQPLKTFTIGFEEGNNEAPFAKQTAQLLGTDHYEHYCTEADAQKIIPDLSYFYDEPFADSSAIPTMLVSRLAKQHVTVALSADGGDEIFAGYDSYPKLLKRITQINRIPDSLKPFFKLLLNALTSTVPKQRPEIRHRLGGLASAMSTDDLSLALGLIHETRKLPDQYRAHFLTEKIGPQSNFRDLDVSQFNNVLNMALAVDYNTYLEGDILTKVDRATMSSSLEGREPLLDHRILEFAAQLPTSYKFDGITTKRILKDIVHQYLPVEKMQRPKTGFSLPIYTWLRRDLSYLVNEALNSEKLQCSGIFEEKFISKQVSLFKAGKFHYKPFIWKLLVFQMWYERWM